jgi:predicted dehydrogenase
MKHRLEIHGELGGVIVEGESILRWSVPGVPNPEEVKDEVGDTSGDAKAITSDGHTIQVMDLCDAIRKDRDPMITGEEARKAVELILGVYKSAKTGRPVKFPL